MSGFNEVDFSPELPKKVELDLSLGVFFANTLSLYLNVPEGVQGRVTRQVLGLRHGSFAPWVSTHLDPSINLKGEFFPPHLIPMAH